MQSLSVAEVKARFSEVLAAVQRGATVRITYGRNRRVVALLSPPPSARRRRRLGMMSNKIRVRFRDFPLSDEEFLRS